MGALYFGNGDATARLRIQRLRKRRYSQPYVPEVKVFPGAATSESNWDASAGPEGRVLPARRLGSTSGIDESGRRKWLAGSL